VALNLHLLPPVPGREEKVLMWQNVGGEVAEKEGSGWGLECVGIDRASSGQVDEGGRTDGVACIRISLHWPPALLPRCMLLSIAAAEATATLCFCSAPPEGAPPIPQHRSLRLTCDETSLSRLLRACRPYC
jgi:hypothetical protein